MMKFRREEWFRYKRLGEKWRKPKGISSKRRRKYKSKYPIVSVGYKKPEQLRRLHPSGLKELLVRNIKDMDNKNPKIYGIRFSSKLSRKKRLELQNIATKLGFRILNPVKEEQRDESENTEENGSKGA